MYHNIYILPKDNRDAKYKHMFLYIYYTSNKISFTSLSFLMRNSNYQYRGYENQHNYGKYLL